jgi:hypothetical protein
MQVGKGRISPALVVAIVALIAALGGTALAASGLNHKQKKQVKKIADKEIKKKASGLSVANATNATNATNAVNAANAGTVNGVSVTPFNYRSLASGPTQVILNAGGLTLTVGCDSGGVESLIATTSKSDAEIQSSTTDVVATGTDNENQDQHFNPGETYDVLPDDPGDQLGSLEFSSADSHVSVTFQADDPTPPPVDCVVSGFGFSA